MTEVICTHPERLVRVMGLCKSCYNSQWKPTPEQNKKRNATPASRIRKSRWLGNQSDMYIRDKHRLKRYGLSPEAYQKMLDKQQNKCRVCLEPLTKACVDHDHKTGIVRGVLCSLCNTGLGMLKDNPFILARFIAYLKLTNPQYDWLDTKFKDL